MARAVVAAELTVVVELAVALAVSVVAAAPPVPAALAVPGVETGCVGGVGAEREEGGEEDDGEIVTVVDPDAVVVPLAGVAVVESAVESAVDGAAVVVAHSPVDVRGAVESAVDVDPDVSVELVRARGRSLRAASGIARARGTPADDAWDSAAAVRA